jgi:hypothetical protein
MRDRAVGRHAARLGPIAEEMWALAAGSGLGALVQKRIGPGVCEYRFIRNARPWRDHTPGLAGESPPPSPRGSIQYRLSPGMRARIDELAAAGESINRISCSLKLPYKLVSRRLHETGVTVSFGARRLLGDDDFTEFLRLAAGGVHHLKLASRFEILPRQAKSLLTNHRQRIDAVRAGADPAEVAR